MPRRRNRASRARITDSISATVRRHRSTSSRPATDPDMRQLPQRRQRTAAEVQAIELHVRRVVRGRQRHHQRAQRRRLARSWSADDRDISCRPGQFGDQQIAALLVRAVDQADRHRQGPVPIAVRNQHVEGGRTRQRRQPHPMCGRAVVRQPVQRPRPAASVSSAHVLAAPFRRSVIRPRARR